MPSPHPFHVLLLRHGQTDANANGILQGHQPTPLNALGRLQAQRLAARIAAYQPKVTALISSDLRRAVQTTDAISAACGLASSFDPSWRERAFGTFEGKSVGERETWRAAHGDTDPPGAEPMPAFTARVRRALESLTSLSPAHTGVAVVTHGGPVAAVLRLLAPGPEPARTANCSVLELVRAHDATWRIACLNDVTHLHDLATETDAG